jgi:hypothetical protein
VVGGAATATVAPQITINPQPGMSEETIGRIAAERLAYRMRMSGF